jgi:hypothetical protein
MSFKAGDILSFTAHDATFGMAKVLRIDTLEDLPTPEPVLHLLIYSVRNIFPPNLAHLAEAKPFIAHLPLFESAVVKSGCVHIGYQEVRADELDAYRVWRDAFFSGEAGIFNLPISEAIGIILEALGKKSKL